MSRGNNRNKVSNVNVKKNKAARNEMKMLNLPILIGILITIACLMVAGISSCSNLKGALTMMNPNPAFDKKGGAYMNVNTNMERNRKRNVPVKNHGNSVFVPAEHFTGQRWNDVQINQSAVNHKSRGGKNNVQAAHNVMASSSNGRRGEGNQASRYFYYHFDPNTESFHLREEYTTFPDKPVRVSHLSAAFDSTFQSDLPLSGKYLPSLCKDGHTYGFSDLTTLRNAISELSDAYSYAVDRYLHYEKAHDEFEKIKVSSPEAIIQSPPFLPSFMVNLLEIAPEPFIICSGAHLRPPIHDRHGPININAEDVVIECESCMIDGPGTHFSFGPNAKNAVVRGVTLKGATDTSIIFRHDGANAQFEDCQFVHNGGIGVHGAVADLNSTR